MSNVIIIISLSSHSLPAIDPLRTPLNSPIQRLQPRPPNHPSNSIKAWVEIVFKLTQKKNTKKLLVIIQAETPGCKFKNKTSTEEARIQPWIIISCSRTSSRGRPASTVLFRRTWPCSDSSCSSRSREGSKPRRCHSASSSWNHFHAKAPSPSWSCCSSTSSLHHRYRPRGSAFFSGTA